MVRLSLIAVLALSAELNEMTQWLCVCSAERRDGGFSHLAERIDKWGRRLRSSISHKLLGSAGQRESETAGIKVAKPRSLMVAVGAKPSVKTE